MYETGRGDNVKRLGTAAQFLTYAPFSVGSTGGRNKSGLRPQRSALSSNSLEEKRRGAAVRGAGAGTSHRDRVLCMSHKSPS